MAVYLPVVGALVARRTVGETALSVVGALLAVAVILALALQFGEHLSRALSGGSDEALLLSVFGLTLLVGGLAEQVHVSAAIGAFLVGLALSGPVQHRAGALVAPLRDLFAATFFLFFSFQLLPSDLIRVAVPALVLAAVAIATKFVAARLATRPLGVGRLGRRRAGAALAARGEFSIVIASLGAPAGGRRRPHVCLSGFRPRHCDRVAVAGKARRPSAPRPGAGLGARRLTRTTRGYKASSPTSPVRIRSTDSAASTQILPSPIFPVRAASTSPFTTRSTSSSSTTISILDLGNEVDLVLGTSVHLGVTALAAETTGRRSRSIPRHAELVEAPPSRRRV